MITRFLLIFLLVIVVPISDFWITPWLKKSNDPRKKIKVYAGTSLWLWLAAAIVWWQYRPGFLYSVRPPELIGRLPGSGFVYGFSAALIAGMLAQTLLARFNPKIAAVFQRQMRKLDFFLPVTSAERAWFAVVSVSAGICEEVLYRGFLYHSFADFWQWGMVAGLVASAIVFGLGHGYQGLTGIFATGILGAVLALLYLSTGSLAVPMVFHAAIDLRILLLPRLDRVASSAPASAA